jgi:hypothetical protein
VDNQGEKLGFFDLNFAKKICGNLFGNLVLFCNASNAYITTNSAVSKDTKFKVNVLPFQIAKKEE